MNNIDIKKEIRETLETKQLTCVISNNNKILFTSKDRGVKPIIDFILSFTNDDTFYLADKVIGKAAALLCVKAKINYVFTKVISSPAKTIFDKYGISYEFDSEVPAIQNRTKTDLCPMEGLAKGVETPEEMYKKIVLWLASK